jgi:hypothetical protein
MSLVPGHRLRLTVTGIATLSENGRNVGTNEIQNLGHGVQDFDQHFSDIYWTQTATFCFLIQGQAVRLLQQPGQ